MMSKLSHDRRSAQMRMIKTRRFNNRGKPQASRQVYLETRKALKLLKLSQGWMNALKFRFAWKWMGTLEAVQKHKWNFSHNQNSIPGH